MNQLGKKLKIGLQLSKLLTNINWHTFLRYSVLYIFTLKRYWDIQRRILVWPWNLGYTYAIWPTTSVLPAVVVLAHGQPPVWCWTSLVRRRHWETVHLPSPDRVSGTAFLLPSVIRHCRRQSSESCWKLICLFNGRGAGDLWTGALEMYWLTN